MRDLISQAVERVVRQAEPPVAIMLSGGIDSATIAALAPELPAFTGWYDAPGCDEREFAALLSGGRGWVHTEIRPSDLIDSIDAVAALLGDLPCGPGAIGQYVLANHVAGFGFRTILTGEGGDELFGGYARQQIVAGLEPPEGYEEYELPPDYPRDIPRALDLEWDALPTLCEVDERIAGAYGLRVVTPLLDPWLVAHVHTRETSKRIGKALLKEAMRGVVPDAILDRRDKVGFAAPFVAWGQQEPLRSFFLDRLGYLPDPAEPWSRDWWYDLRRKSLERDETLAGCA